MYNQVMKNLSQLKLKENEKKALQEVKGKLLEKFPNAELILYGSKARGDYEEFSDIDLLILLDFKVPQRLKEEIRGIIYDIELEYDVVFGTIIEDRDFWQSALANAMPFHWNIDREGVYV
jgi:predicted nucleotidyltransferase